MAAKRRAEMFGPDALTRSKNWLAMDSAKNIISMYFSGILYPLLVHKLNSFQNPSVQLHTKIYPWIMMTWVDENLQRHLESSLLPQQRLQRNSWHAIFLSVVLLPSFLPLFLRQLRPDENHWHLHPPGLSSITTSHNIPSNQCNYQSAITPTWLRTLLILMTDQRWPTQSAADKLPLIFTPSIFVQTWCSSRNDEFSTH